MALQGQIDAHGRREDHRGEEARQIPEVSSRRDAGRRARLRREHRRCTAAVRRKGDYLQQGSFLVAGSSLEILSTYDGSRLELLEVRSMVVRLSG